MPDSPELQVKDLNKINKLQDKVNLWFGVSVAPGALALIEFLRWPQAIEHTLSTPGPHPEIIPQLLPWMIFFAMWWVPYEQGAERSLIEMSWRIKGFTQRNGDMPTTFRYRFAEHFISRINLANIHLPKLRGFGKIT